MNAVRRTDTNDYRQIKNDTIAIYMVKYGYGEMAANMDNKARKRLKDVLEDMVKIEIRKYSIDYIETKYIKDEEGNFIWNKDGTLQKEFVTVTLRYKDVSVVTKNADAMQDEYGFSEDQKQDL